MKKPSLLKPIAAALGVSALTFVVNASAAPVYLLLEGYVSASLNAGNHWYESVPSACAPDHYCTFDRSKGQLVSIRAVWDDVVFGGDANAAANQGSYGSAGFYFPNTQEANIEQADGQSLLWVSLQEPKYTYSIGAATTTHRLFSTGQSGFSIMPWSVSLNTEQGATGATISLRVASPYSGYGYGNTTFTLALAAPDAGLDAALFGFKWDASMGGDASGKALNNYSHIASSTDLQEIIWSRAVLSYDPNDLAPVPLPAAALLFGSGLLGLFGGGLRKRLG